MDVWSFYKELEEQIDHDFSQLTAHCEVVFEKLWEIKDLLNSEFNKLAEREGEFEPKEQFILILFIRNLAYLIASYKLVKIGLTNPARNITRTVYEQILRSVLFSKYPDEAQLWYDYIEIAKSDPKKEDLIKKIKDRPRRYWSAAYMRSKLYKGDLFDSHKKFYEQISHYSHPHLVSLYSDFGDLRFVEDNLQGILGLTYNEIDVFQEMFSDKLSDELNSSITATKDIIGLHLTEINTFTPNIC